MRISNNYVSFNQRINNQTSLKSNNSVSFKSLFADAKPCNMQDYANYDMLMQILGHTDFREIKGCSTRIFREHVSQLALAKLLNPNEKTQIKVLGCSDGSEAYAYAIAMKESMGTKAKENIKILGIDNKPYIIALANTGKIVCSDIEKEYANNLVKGRTPLTGSGWDKYLQKTSRPENFSKLVDTYPQLAYAEKEPVARKTIGNGLEWYRVNQENLPEITFKKDDLFNQLNSTDNVKNEVYVVANTAGYMLEKGPEAYIKIFEDIKNANKGNNKNIYVVVGDLEQVQLNPNMRTMIANSDKFMIRHAIKELGFSNLSESELDLLDVNCPKEAASKIYKLAK